MDRNTEIAESKLGIPLSMFTNILVQLGKFRSMERHTILEDAKLIRSGALTE
jgi:hypothetical protein